MTLNCSHILISVCPSLLHRIINSNFGSNKTKICIDKLPFTLHLLVGLIHNKNYSKRTKNGPYSAFKKSVKVSFVTSGIEKNRKKKGDFLFLLICIFLVKLQYKAHKIILQNIYYRLQTTNYRQHITDYRLHRLHTLHYTLQTTHYVLHTTHYSLYTTQYILNTLHYTLHTKHHTLHTTNYTLHTFPCWYDSRASRAGSGQLWLGKHSNTSWSKPALVCTNSDPSQLFIKLFSA